MIINNYPPQKNHEISKSGLNDTETTSGVNYNSDDISVHSCSEKKDRIEYIDAVRGATMLIVVFQHVRAFSFGLYEDDSILSMIYLSFMLPMFFFVSGFASYKKINSSIWGKVIDKFRQLVIPTVVFLLLHNYFPAYQEWGFPGGYWFTYSLFWITAIYLLISRPLYRLSDKSLLIVLLCISLVFIVLRGYFGIRLDTGWPTWLTIRKVLTYFIFFVVGVGARIYIKNINEIFALPWCRNLIIIISLSSFLFSIFLSEFLPAPVYSIYRLLLDISSTILIFMLFNLTREWWANKNNVVAKWMCFVGRRTLDLYMIHYFFLPNLMAYGYFFKSSGNCVIELFVVGFITMLVTILALSIGSLIRLSPLLSYWILGTKRVTN